MKADFDSPNVRKTIIKLALPMIAAQFVNLLYSIVDRIFIGHIPGIGPIALTSVGLCFPIIQIVAAFTNLYGFNGGSPLSSIERGKGNLKEAGLIMGNSFALLVITGVVLTLLTEIFASPLLFIFGASDKTINYALSYLRLYAIGFTFSLIATGMNAFINSQGFSNVGMKTVLIGALLNFILDPIFIFIFGWGVRGAALATCISQLVSALWVLKFLTSSEPILKLKKSDMVLEKKRVKSIVTLGTSGFIMGATNSAVQIVCNRMALMYGGDILVGAFTIINSVREIFSTPVNGLTSATSPVMSYNYGAKRYDRVMKASNFAIMVSATFSTIFALSIELFPNIYISLFSSDPTMLDVTARAMRIYFSLFVFMSFQQVGQSTFVALGKAKHAIFFSLFRKIIIVVPLTILLPLFMGSDGVVAAEPISNLIGGMASYLTMRLVTSKEFKKSSS
ncbi:MAG: MATE family efflux transporter [Spirochaetales bacterium]|uniref:MATE family efflux transporter n=1 Tax=Bullifex sp. TaxID=2815808 RepID=UPI002A548C5F|nr:MATE family efflux transporter [Bullifex sp.]MDD5972259.1 MATE family efflux transporter [Spirochaetales bacterium]MDD7271748.1 MATE family efflux transporter [Spirochaetales bacterium]MDY4066782.1 MATE family efflux transporter [Bullifex sp.]